MSLDILDALQLWPPFGGGVGGPVVPPPASTYALAGPDSGPVGFGAGFTATLGAGMLPAPVTLAFFATGLPGTFSPATVVLTNTSRSGSASFEPASAGLGLIGATNNGGLDDPVSLAFTALDAAPPSSSDGNPIVMLRPGRGMPAARVWRPGRRRSRG